MRASTSFRLRQGYAGSPNGSKPTGDVPQAARTGLDTLPAIWKRFGRIVYERRFCAEGQTGSGMVVSASYMFYNHFNIFEGGFYERFC
jgi:hypothetical protein